MSRTYKDMKSQKSKRSHIHRPRLSHEFLRVKQNGFDGDFAIDCCPECGAPLEFEAGYLTCTDCGWGAYTPQERNPDLELKFEKAV